MRYKNRIQHWGWLEHSDDLDPSVHVQHPNPIGCYKKAKKGREQVSHVVRRPSNLSSEAKMMLHYDDGYFFVLLRTTPVPTKASSLVPVILCTFCVDNGSLKNRTKIYQVVTMNMDRLSTPIWFLQRWALLTIKVTTEEAFKRFVLMAALSWRSFTTGMYGEGRSYFLYSRHVYKA